MHPDKVAGLVLVAPRAYDLASDSPGEDLDPRKDAQLALAPSLARLGLVRLARPPQDRIDEQPPIYRARAAAALGSTHHNAGVLGEVVLGA